MYTYIYMRKRERERDPQTETQRQRKRRKKWAERQEHHLEIVRLLLRSWKSQTGQQCTRLILSLGISYSVLTNIQVL